MSGLSRGLKAVAQRCSVKKVLKILQNSQKNKFAVVSFLIKLQASGNFIKKETLAEAQVNGATKSYQKIIFVSATKIGENTTNILDCCFSS